MAINIQNTTLGCIGIVEKNEHITQLFFEADGELKGVQEKSSLLDEAFSQLNAYLGGKLKNFSLPLYTEGTPFMKCVWDSLLKIDYGKTITYKDLAFKINHPLAFRAVGMANHKNPLPIFIPCHRVIGVKRNLIGYRWGIFLKKKLLELEAQHSS